LKKNDHFFRRFALVYLISIFCCFSLARGLIIKLPLKELVTKAEAIIIGEVKDIKCQWSIDHSVVLTIVTINIHEVLKGNINNTQILIQYPGGEVGDIGLKVSDMPSFLLNENVLVFLKYIKDPQSEKNSPLTAMSILQSFSILGAAQGKYSIDKDEIAKKSGYVLNSNIHEPDILLPLTVLKKKIKKFLLQNLKGRDKKREKIKY